VLGVSTGLTREAIDARGLPALRDEETLQLGLNYRGCRLSRDLRAAPGALAGALLAGDRLPDAPDAVDGQGLHDLLGGPGAALLAFGEGWAAILAQARADHALKTFDLGATTAAAQACGVGPDGGLLVIRPDGYVGLAVDRRDPEPIMSYLAAIAAPATGA
jgi:hypothetical protein